MRFILYTATLIAITLLTPIAWAQDKSSTTSDARITQGQYFQHKDWELACDNTRTCRAAGYPEEGALGSVASILLSRAAGAGTPVTFAFKAQNEATGDDVQGKFNVQLGSAIVGPFTFETNITEAQAKTLLPQLLKSQKIELTQGTKRWRISLAGFTAVALKMDELQKRVGTIGALTPSARGSKDESSVAQPLLMPTINVPKLPLQTGFDKVLIDPIKAALGKTDCSAKTEAVSIEQLNDKQVLVELSPCERAAYNEENAYFIANLKAPHSPKRINFDHAANECSQGVIASFQKGRGAGDCVSTAEFAWDGVRFVEVSVAGSGMCRGFVGGAWEMPTMVSKVNNPNIAPTKKKSK
jgi:hypothetical protein